METEIFINCNPKLHLCGKEPLIGVHKTHRSEHGPVKTFSRYAWKGKVSFKLDQWNGNSAQK